MAKDKIGKDCLRCATIALHPTLKSKYYVYLKIKTYCNPTKRPENHATAKTVFYGD
jgi:hypothetical protein